MCYARFKKQTCRQRELVLERERKAALIEHLFSNGIHKEKNKATEIGLIPSSWEIRRADSICQNVTDGTHDSPQPKEDGFFLITSAHISTGTVNFDAAYRISPEDFEEVRRRSRVDENDVLFSMIGSIGAVALAPAKPEFAIKNVGLFKTGGDGTIAKWLFYFFQSGHLRSYLSARISGTSQKYVPLWLLRSLPIPIPPESERDAIVRTLAMCDAKCDGLERELSCLEDLFHALLEELMAGRLSTGTLQEAIAP